MKIRIITGLVAICVLVPVLIFADYIIFPIAVALCSLFAVYEMLSCIGLKASISISLPLYLIAGAFPFAVRYCNLSTVKDLAFTLLIFAVIYLFTVLIFSHGKYKIEQIGVCAFTMLYILFGFNALIVLHDHEPAGEYVYLIAMLGAWVTDTFAYFCGVLFGRGGKHKLIPDVSPKKTVEGSIGGTLFCILFMVLFGVIIEAVEPNLNANLILFAVVGLLSAVVSQIGDLSMSVIKRAYGIKDYGKIMPGHGGILDRFDSVLAVGAMLMAFCNFFNLFEVVL